MGALASFGFELHSVKSNPTAAFYSPFLRFWELMAGSILAWLKLYKGEMFRGIAERTGPYLSAVLLRNPARADYVRLCGNILSVIGLSLILTAVFALDNKDFPGYKALLPVMGAVLMISAGKDAFLNRYLLSNRVIVWFGLISYPLYIWHWPLLSFAWIVDGDIPHLNVRIGCVVLAVIMSSLTYYFVEPRLRWGRYGGYKAAGLLSVMIVVGVAGYSLMSHDGYKVRIPMEADDMKVSKRIDSVWNSGHQRYNDRFPNLLKFSRQISGFLEKEDGKNNIALLGDSHANALLPGLLMHESENDGIVYFGTNCAFPFIGVQTGCDKELKCSSPTKRFNYEPIVTGFDYVLSHPEIKKVILTSFAGCFMHSSIRSLDNQTLSSTEQILQDGISRTFKTLSDAGKEVIYALDVPTFSNDGYPTPKVQSCIAKVRSLNSPSLPLRSALYLNKFKVSLDEVCSMPEKDNGALEERSLFQKLIEKEADKYSNIHIVDLMPSFCQNKTCYMIKNGKLLYADPGHLNAAGGIVAASAIFKVLGE